MKAVLWRLDESQAALYTEDRDVLRRLFEMPAFAGRGDAASSTYQDARGRVFGWQIVFAITLWPRVTRHLRQHAIEVEDRTATRAARPAVPRPAARRLRAAGRA